METSPLQHKETREYVEISAAVIEEGGKFLVAKRAKGKPFSGRWEFPGGKLELGETAEACLKREIKEELGIEPEIIRPLKVIDYEYKDNRRFQLHTFLCKIPEGPLPLREHDATRWVDLEGLGQLDLLEADKLLVPALEEMYGKSGN